MPSRPEQSNVVGTEEKKKEGLGGTRNFLRLLNKLFLPYCAVVAKKYFPLGYHFSKKVLSGM